MPQSVSLYTIVHIFYVYNDTDGQYCWHCRQKIALCMSYHTSIYRLIMCDMRKWNAALTLFSGINRIIYINVLFKKKKKKKNQYCIMLFAKGSLVYNQ